MPCYRTGSYSGDRELEAQEAQEAVKKLEAMLCGLFRAAEKNEGVDAMLEKVDFSQCGVARPDFKAWWKKHQKEDKRKGA